MQKLDLNLSHVAVGALALFCGLAIGSIGLRLGSSPNEDSLVYAIAGDRTILGKEILPTIKEDLRQIERSKYLLKKRAVTELILEKPLATNPEAQLNESDRHDFADFLKRRNLNLKKMTKKQQEDAANNFKIFSNMQARKVQEQAQVKKMKIEWRIPITFLDEPVSVSKGSLAPLITGSSARTLIVFANYHCPYCPEAFHKINVIREKYKKEVTLHFRFALNEPEASVVFLSAVATACANEQGRFGDFFKEMFAAVPMNQNELLTIAEKSMLNKQQFEICMKSDSAKAQVRQDIQDSKKLTLVQPGVIFINGRQLAIQEPLDYLEDVINFAASN